jgi:hypothetical protein
VVVPQVLDSLNHLREHEAAGEEAGGHTH